MLRLDAKIEGELAAARNDLERVNAELAIARAIADKKRLEATLDTTLNRIAVFEAQAALARAAKYEADRAVASRYRIPMEQIARFADVKSIGCDGSITLSNGDKITRDQFDRR